MIKFPHSDHTLFHHEYYDGEQNRWLPLVA
jgi:hypothetical protein